MKATRWLVLLLVMGSRDSIFIETSSRLQPPSLPPSSSFIILHLSSTTNRTYNSQPRLLAAAYLLRLLSCRKLNPSHQDMSTTNNSASRSGPIAVTGILKRTHISSEGNESNAGGASLGSVKYKRLTKEQLDLVYE